MMTVTTALLLELLFSVCLFFYDNLKYVGRASSGKLGDLHPVVSHHTCFLNSEGVYLKEK